MPKLFHKELEVHSFKTKDAFYTWLGKNHKRELGFWLRYFKKGSEIASILPTDAVDVALCWGWIDGLINKYDEQSYVVRFTPRRPKSVWSKVNVAKVERLIESGLMQPRGLEQVEAAQADGRWQAAYGGQAMIELPEEFMQQVNCEPDVQAFFKTLNKANRYAIAFRIATAVGDAKRAKVIAKMIEMLRQKKTLHTQN